MPPVPFPHRVFCTVLPILAVVPPLLFLLPARASAQGVAGVTPEEQVVAVEELDWRAPRVLVSMGGGVATEWGPGETRGVAALTAERTVWLGALGCGGSCQLSVRMQGSLGVANWGGQLGAAVTAGAEAGWMHVCTISVQLGGSSALQFAGQPPDDGSPRVGGFGLGPVGRLGLRLRLDESDPRASLGLFTTWTLASPLLTSGARAPGACRLCSAVYFTLGFEMPF